MPGGVDEYLRLVEAARAKGAQGGTAGDAAPASEPSADAAPAGPSSGLSNAERQRLRREVASLERRIATARTRAEELEAAMAEVDPTDYQALQDQQVKIVAAREAVDELETQWLEVSEQLEG